MSKEQLEALVQKWFDKVLTLAPGVAEDMRRAAKEEPVPKMSVGTLHMIRTDLERLEKPDLADEIDRDIAAIGGSEDHENHEQFRAISLLVAKVERAATDPLLKRRAEESYYLSLQSHVVTNVPNHLRELRAKLEGMLDLLP